METKEVPIKVFVLPGGFMPTGGEDGNVGYDVRIRGIIGKEMDPEHPYMHETLWNFQETPKTPHLFQSFYDRSVGSWRYNWRNSESILLGAGFVLGGESTDWYAEIAPRSSSALRKVAVSHFDGVPIDSNFRSEPVVYLTHSQLDPIEIYHGWSPVQLKFFCKCCCPKAFLRPRLVRVDSIEELGQTTRGNKWNGSSDRLFQQTELPLALNGRNGHYVFKA